MALATGRFGKVTRRLVRAPLFTVMTILTLGVGIGANTAIFSLVHGVLLTPLPYPEPERLVGVWHRSPVLNIDPLNISPSTYLTYRESSRVFEDIGMWDNVQVSVTGRGDPERLEALLVNDGTLPLLGAQPLVGRLFTREDDAAGAPQRAVLTYGFWQRKYGGSPDIIGQAIVVDGESTEVVGVLPASFRFLARDPALLLTFRINRAEVFFGHFSFQGIARLKPGVTLDQANADVDRLLEVAADTFPMPPGFTREMLESTRIGANVRPLEADVIGDVGPVLWILLGTVGFVLLIACANVANLFLVRAEGRHHEFALRTALGASRGRLARELLDESVVLGLTAGLVGIGLAALGLRLLVWLAPAGLPRLEEVGIDLTVLVFTLALSILTGVVFGLLPLARLGRATATWLKDGGRSSSDGPGRHRVRNVLVVAEIALALVLIVVSGLMVRTFVALRQVDPGFRDPEAVQTFRISVPEALVEDPKATMQVHRLVAEKLAAVPGVQRVGLSSSVTMAGHQSNDPIFVEDRPSPEGQLPPMRRYRWVGPGYFETMGTRLIAGRHMTWNDIEQMAPVVIVSENLAREYFGEPARAIGRRLRQTPRSRWSEIVGVVGDERDDGLNQAAPAIVHWPMFEQRAEDRPVFTYRNMGYVVRSARAGSPSFQRELQAAVWSVNPALPLAGVRTLADVRAGSMAQTSFALTMLAIAGGVALLLGIVGLYGVIAYVASQRTREIGVRMALGAEARHVVGLFVGHGMRLAGVGLALGLVAAFWLTRYMAALVFGVSTLDPATYTIGALALALTALLATYLPARRAAGADPMAALRSEV